MTPCPIEWLVIPAPDIEAACRFYSEVFGFETTRFSDTYYVFKAGNLSGGLDAGLVPSADSMSFSITVENMDAVSGGVEDHGGRILKAPYDLPGGLGKCCQCADPNGQVFELYCQTRKNTTS